MNTGNGTRSEEIVSHDIVISRSFDIPRWFVFMAWVDAARLMRWLGPEGFTNLVCELDPQPGGVLRVHMCAPDETVYRMSGVISEVTRSRRIAFTSVALGEQGEPLFEVFHMVTLAERGGRTELELRARVLNVSAAVVHHLTGMRQGWSEALERLDAYLRETSSDLRVPRVNNEPLVLEQILNVPVDRVWKALTDRDEIRCWYFDIEDFRPEIGFEFRFSASKAGKRYRHVCRIIEVLPGRKLSYSWRYEGHEGMSQVTFEMSAVEGGTSLRLTHAGLETFPADNRDFVRTAFSEGWDYILGTALTEFLEGAAVVNQ